MNGTTITIIVLVIILLLITGYIFRCDIGKWFGQDWGCSNCKWNIIGKAWCPEGSPSPEGSTGGGSTGEGSTGGGSTGGGSTGGGSTGGGSTGGGSTGGGSTVVETPGGPLPSGVFNLSDSISLWIHPCNTMSAMDFNNDTINKDPVAFTYDQTTGIINYTRPSTWVDKIGTNLVYYATSNKISDGTNDFLINMMNPNSINGAYKYTYTPSSSPGRSNVDIVLLVNNGDTNASLVFVNKTSYTPYILGGGTITPGVTNAYRCTFNTFYSPVPSTYTTPSINFTYDPTKKTMTNTTVISIPAAVFGDGDVYVPITTQSTFRLST